MAKNKGDRAARAQDALKEEWRHKVTCGAFKSRNEALQRAAEAARKALEAKKVKAKVSGQ